MAEGLFEQICLKLLSRLLLESQGGQQVNVFQYRILMCLPWNVFKTSSVPLEQISICGNHKAA